MLKQLISFFAIIETVLAADLLVFTPSLIDLQPDIAGTQVQVSVANPATLVNKVQFQTTELFRLDKCTLNFGPGQPAQQTITVYPAGAVSMSAETQLVAQYSSLYSGTVKQTIPVRRNVATPAAYCQSAGDPHYRTFDGTGYSYQGAAGNWYYLVNSQSMTIQTQFNQAGGDTRVNGNIAIRHWDGVLLIELGGGAYSIRKQGNQNVFSSVTESADAIDVVFVDGTTIHIGNMWAADITVRVPGFYSGKVAGLCGDYNGGDDSINGDNYLVPANDLYFQNPNAPSIIPAPQYGEQCVLSATGKKFITWPTQQCITPPTSGQAATQYCTDCFSRFTCGNSIVDKNYFINCCAADISAGGDPKTIAKAMVDAYQQAVGCAAQSCWLANDISMSITLQRCGRVAILPVKAQYAVSNGAVTNTKLTLPAKSKTCQKADGTFGFAF